MDQLLELSNIDYTKLKRTIHKIVATEISKLSEPCYYPSLKKYYYELLYICKLKEKDIKEYVKRFYAGTPASKWKLHRDPISNFQIFLMNVFLRRREVAAYKSTMLLFVVRYYTNLMNKQIQYCNKDVFRYTMDNLTQTHLFSREKSIAGALSYLAQVTDKKFRNGIHIQSVKQITEMITACRTRVSQSIKSFAESYYKAAEEGSSIREPYEDEEGEQVKQIEKTSRIVDDAVKKICVYKVVDKKAVDDARALTKIRHTLAVDIAKAITDIKYTNNIHLILELFIKDLRDVSSICGDEYLKYVRSLMAVKRTKALVYFKQQINILLVLAIKDMKFTRQFNKLTRQTQSLISLYLAYYVTMIMRNIVC